MNPSSSRYKAWLLHNLRLSFTLDPLDIRRMSLQWLLVFARADKDSVLQAQYLQQLEQHYPEVVASLSPRVVQ